MIIIVIPGVTALTFLRIQRLGTARPGEGKHGGIADVGPRHPSCRGPPPVGHGHPRVEESAVRPYGRPGAAVAEVHGGGGAGYGGASGHGKQLVHGGLVGSGVRGRGRTLGGDAKSQNRDYLYYLNSNIAVVLLETLAWCVRWSPVYLRRFLRRWDSPVGSGSC